MRINSKLVMFGKIIYGLGAVPVGLNIAYFNHTNNWWVIPKI